MSEKLDEIAERATNELHTPGKTKRKPNGSTFRTVRAALAEADADVERLRAALRHAVEWLDEQGCDCGTDEPGTCALCEANAALRGKGEK